MNIAKNINLQNNGCLKQVGENGNIEYGFSLNNLKEKLTQIYFQLVRNNNNEYKKLELELESVIGECSKVHERYNFTIKNEELLELLYLMIGNTRDIVKGKGEYTLSYMMIWVFYKYYPELALNAIKSFIFLSGKNENEKIKPYGSWKDLKYLSEYVLKKCEDIKHPIIEYCCELYALQIIKDLKNANEENKTKLTLAAKWCPREKGRFSFLYSTIAEKLHPEFLKTAINKNTILKAKNKAKMVLRKSLSKINKLIDTPQIKMCGKQWATINFNHVSSNTMNKNKKAFLNINYVNNKVKYDLQLNNEDRIECANNLKNHIKEIKESNESPNKQTTKKIHGKCLNVYEIITNITKLISIHSDEFYLYNYIHKNNNNNNEAKELFNYLYENNKEEMDIIQLQWDDLKSKMKKTGKQYIIPMADTSYSMNTDNSKPMYSSIGLSILMSEINDGVFKDRIMTFSESPEWVNLSEATHIVEKVILVRKTNCGLNTNFYKAMELILDVIRMNELNPEEVNKISLIVFSDMQIDEASSTNMNTMYENIEKMFEYAGLQSKYETSYQTPHILFWNLRNTNGFPNLSTQKNTTMLSGYSQVLINRFTEVGCEVIKDYNPFLLIRDILKNKRYEYLSSSFHKIMNK